METIHLPNIDPLIIRKLSYDEFVQYPMNWALQEGWNPGNADAEVFYHTEPDAHLGIELRGRIIGCGSIPSYDENFGFMGLFIIDPFHRVKGIGRAFWNYRRDKLLRKLRAGAAIGMDGVFNMQEFYQKGGFHFSHRNLRMQGIAVKSNKPTDCSGYQSGDFDLVLNYDRLHFGCERKKFLHLWLNHPQVNTILFKEKGEIKGLLCLRKCKRGYKIGPLFAEQYEIALKLLDTALSQIPGETYFLDIPEINKSAVTLARILGLSGVFGCARMYLGEPPQLPWNEIFGITTFEMG